MLKIKKIAVTGGLAAGKTTVCNFFKQLGACVVDADAIAHQLLSPSTPIGQQVIGLLGSDIFDDHQFDRRKIAAKVFSQPDLLSGLEQILHPAVFDEMERRYQQTLHEQKHPLFVAEIPLLYETDAHNQFDLVISVFASDEICKKRFIDKTHSSKEEFEKRMMRQLDPRNKAARADFTIENNGDMKQLDAKVKELFSQFTNH